MKVFTLLPLLVSLITASSSSKGKKKLNSSKNSGILDDNVDIASLNWIKPVKELANLKGILVPAGHQGYLKSFEIIVKASADFDSFKSSLYEELYKLYKSNSNDFLKVVKMYETMYRGPMDKDFMRLAFKKNDFDLVKFLKRNTRLSVIVGPEAINYLGNNPSFFFEKFTDSDWDVVDIAKAMLSIDFGKNEAEWFFKGHHDEAVLILKSLCSYTNSSYLLQPEIQEKVVQIYNILSPEHQLKAQRRLYYRGLLGADEIAPRRVYLPKYSDYNAMLLGPIKDSIFRYESGSGLFGLVMEAAGKDSTIIDWLISRIDRSLVVKPQLATQKAPPNEQLDFLEPEFAKELRRGRRYHYILDNNKVASYVYSGQTDFLRFLKEAPVELLGLVTYSLALTGTAQEFEVYMQRADEDSVRWVYKAFWRFRNVDPEYSACALLLLDRVSKFSEPTRDIRIITDRMYVGHDIAVFKHPEVLLRLNSLGIKVYFDFGSIQDALLDDEAFEKMKSLRQVLYDSIVHFHDADLMIFVDDIMTCGKQSHMEQLKYYHSLDLKMSAQQTDRILQVLGLSAHEYLKLYWSQRKLRPVKMDLNYFYESLVLLKRWKLDHPKEVERLASADSRPLSELVQDQSILSAFDKETKELIRAHLLLAFEI